jgi:hypothetical protein
LKFSPNGPGGPAGRGKLDFFRKSSWCIPGTADDLAASFRLSMDSLARGGGSLDRRGMPPRSGTLDPYSWSMLQYVMGLSVRKRLLRLLILDNLLENQTLHAWNWYSQRDVEMERIRKSKLCERVSSGVDREKGGCGV